jgi:hypothetical protein
MKQEPLPWGLSLCPCIMPAAASGTVPISQILTVTNCTSLLWVRNKVSDSLSTRRNGQLLVTTTAIAPEKQLSHTLEFPSCIFSYEIISHTAPLQSATNCGIKLDNQTRFSDVGLSLNCVYSSKFYFLSWLSLNSNVCWRERHPWGPKSRWTWLC